MIRAARALLLFLAVAPVAAACSSTNDRSNVGTLHALVAAGLFSSLSDTRPDTPYLVDIANLCSAGGVDTSVTAVQLTTPLAGRLRISGWGVRDSNTIRPGEPDGPGAVAGRLSEYPDYTHAHVLNPCIDQDRTTDLLVEVDRTSTSSAAVAGVSLDYSTPHGHGHLRIASQIALCQAPNTAIVRRQFVGK